MSKDIGDLVAAVMQAVAAFQESTDRVDEAAARKLGLNRTDLRCLDILDRAGRLTAGGLAAGAGLSPGAATLAIDRLERAGYVQRRHDEQDRRRVLVEPTPQARRRTDVIWEPIAEESRRRLASRSAAELRTILQFLEEGRDMQIRHAERIQQ